MPGGAVGAAEQLMDRRFIPDGGPPQPREQQLTDDEITLLLEMTQRQLK